MTCDIPLVGMHFRPPAKEVLSLLSMGTSLILQPEPTNPYDPNAVMVLVNMGDFHTDLIAMLDGILPDGYSASELCAQGLLHLGYLAATGAKTARGGPGNTRALMMLSQGPCEAKLSFAPEGYPTVTVQPCEEECA